MICGIYALKAPIGDGLYIGSSKHIEERTKGHMKRLRGCYHPNNILQSAFNKYGQLTDHTLLVCEEKNLLLYEQAFLDFYQPRYNISRIAGRVEFTPEVLAKQLAFKKGRPRSAEAKAKTSVTLKGRKWSKIRRKNYEENGISEETKKKLSSVLKGIKRSPETIEKMKAYQSKRIPWPMPKWTEERRARQMLTIQRKRKMENVKRENPDCN